MDHRLWHALLHVATHAGRHLFGEHEKRPGSPRPDGLACQKCSATPGTLYITKCCKVLLCESCKDRWQKEGGSRCGICGHVSWW